MLLPQSLLIQGLFSDLSRGHELENVRSLLQFAVPGGVGHGMKLVGPLESQPGFRRVLRLGPDRPKIGGLGLIAAATPAFCPLGSAR